MTLCPACGFNNIEGMDACEKCGTDLFNLGSERKPVTNDMFEVDIMNETLDILDLQYALCISESIKLKEAIKLLDERKKGAAYIIKDDEVIGIVTAHDIVQKASKLNPLSLDAPITEFMSKNIETLPVYARIVDAMHLINIGGHEYLLVTTENSDKYKYLGIRGILSYIMKKNPNLLKMQTEGEKKYLSKS